MLTYACCNSLLFPVDVQYSTRLKHWGTCCVLRHDQTADLNHSIRLVSILNLNKNTVVRGGLQAISWLVNTCSIFPFSAVSCCEHYRPLQTGKRGESKRGPTWVHGVQVHAM